MKKLFLILHFLFIFQYSLGQDVNSTNTDKKRLSDTDFILAKELYLKMSKTDVYIAQKKATLKLIDNLGDIKNPDSLESFDFMKTDEGFLKYISENLYSTKFKNVNEAVALRKSCNELNSKMINDNSKLFEMIKLASVDQLIEILKPDSLDEYGN